MITPFQQKVYDALVLIPRGRVTTYKILADFIHCKSSQAIGQALTKNPNAPHVPCHRVIKTDGSLGGYAFGILEKKTILASEGVYFDEKGVLSSQDTLWLFS